MTESTAINRINPMNTPKHLVTLGRPLPKRLNKPGFDENVIHLTDVIKRTLRIPTSQYIFVRSLHNRKTFGDIDIVISKAHLPGDWKAYFAANVTKNKFFADIPDTDTTVFEYGNYQVNVHAYTGNIWHANNFLRNEGASTLIGVLANSLGFEYTLNGLYLRTGVPEVPSMKASLDDSMCLRMLGISQEFWDYYMYKEDDAYSLMTSSNFFNREVFLALEGSDQESKSPILKNFIAYLKKNPVISGEIKFDLTAESSKKTITLNFKNFASRTYGAYEQLIRRTKIDELFDLKFNHEKVRDITELTGGLLLKFMNSFALSHENVKKFEQYILTSLPETITNALLAHKAATVTAEEIEAQQLADATALAVATAQAAIVPEPVPEPPKLVGKAKAKAKAVAKKAKEPELPPAKLAKVAKTPKLKAAKSLKQIAAEAVSAMEVTAASISEPPHPRGDAGPTWPFPNN